MLLSDLYWCGSDRCSCVTSQRLATTGIEVTSAHILAWSSQRSTLACLCLTSGYVAALVIYNVQHFINIENVLLTQLLAVRAGLGGLYIPDCTVHWTCSKVEFSSFYEETSLMSSVTHACLRRIELQLLRRQYIT